MKCFLFCLFAAALSAQTPPTIPPGVPPGFANPPAASAPTKEIPPDTVVAEVDGKKYTAADVDKLMDIFGASPQMQANARANPQKAFGYILLMQHLAEEAQKANLDKQSPLKEQLEYNRLGALSQAELNQVRNFDINVSLDDEQKEYNEHPERFQQAKVKVIYIAFLQGQAALKEVNGKKPRTEAEAKAKIADLRMQLLSGADFGKLAQENSDDKESAAKGGDFPMITHTGPYPDTIKKAVFSLKPGEVSEPIRQPNGFYLIRLEESKVQPYKEIRTQIYNDLKQKRFNDWIEDLQKRYEVKVENPAYFTPQRAPLPPKAR